MDISIKVAQYLKYKDAYYNGTALVSDMEFDDLEREIAALAPNHPCLNMVGSPVRSGAKVKLTIPMLSTEKALSAEELVDWLKSRQRVLQSVQLIATPKLDGMSCELRYSSGVLKQAVSRGDGEEGEDITAKVRYIVPSSIPTNEDVLIRGELVLSFADFETLNTLVQEPMSNPRNAVVGLIMEEAISPEKLRLISYAAFEYVDSDQEVYSHELLEIEKLGIPTIGCEWITEEDLVASTQRWTERRSHYKYPVDGVVYRIASNADARTLGRTEKFWKRSVAWKFPADVVIVYPKRINWSQGTKDFTPVVEFDPVLLDGAVIQRASGKSIHNLLALCIHPKIGVELRRSGGVIPWLQKAKGAELTKEVVDFVGNSVPTKCPTCGSEILISEDKRHVSCTSKDCGGKFARQLEIFVKALGIKSLGPALAKELVENYGVLSFSLFIEVVELISDSAPRFSRLHEELREALNREHKPWKILGSIGVARLAEPSARKLILHCGSLNKALMPELTDIKSALGIKNDALAISIFDGLEEVRTEVTTLIRYGIRVSAVASVGSGSQLPTGKTNIVVTGDLVGLTRDEYKEHLESFGIKLATSVSSRTAYLITNDDSTQTSKARKARELGVPIINQQQAKEELGLEF